MISSNSLVVMISQCKAETLPRKTLVDVNIVYRCGVLMKLAILC